MAADRWMAQWDTAHLMVIGLTGAAALSLIGFRRSLRARDDHVFRRMAAAVLLSDEVIAFAIAVAEGHPRVPLQLCDLALILMVCALWSPRPRISELAYFWGVAGSAQAIATPDLAMGFPSYWWIKFFIGHCGVLLGAVYLAVTGRVHATGQSVWRAWGWANLYVLCAGLINGVFGTNYGYLARKPLQPSVLDLAGPWPWYIVIMEIVALGSFFMLAAPWMLEPRCARADGRHPAS